MRVLGILSMQEMQLRNIDFICNAKTSSAIDNKRAVVCVREVEKERGDDHDVAQYSMISCRKRLLGLLSDFDDSKNKGHLVSG